MDALKMTVPGAQLLFHVKHCPGNTNLVIAGGRSPATAWLASLRDYASVHCADKGAQYALAAGLVPTCVFGDEDSATQGTFAQAASLGAQVARFPAYKDDTDLQLLLANLPKENVLATGIWGGRFDHLFSNVYSLLAHKRKQDVQVVLADERELLVLLTADEAVEISFDAPSAVEAISLLPLDATNNLSITGVEWELEKAELMQARPYAISNVLAQGNTSCCCKVHAGAVGLYISWKK